MILLIICTCRDSWWRAVGIPLETDERRRNFVAHYFAGTEEELADSLQDELDDLLNSSPLQEEFCNFLQHTSQ